jgi:hypothetical protein
MSFRSSARRLGWVGVLSVATLGFLAPTAMASQSVPTAVTSPVRLADTYCAAPLIPIVDTTKRAVLVYDRPIVNVMQKFENKGAQVFVLVFDTPPGGNLPSYLNAEVANCPGWSLMGQILPNLVVLAIDMQHQDNAVLLYGKNFGSSMQSKVDGILVSMKSSYDAGNYSQAVYTGLNNTYYTIYPPYNWDWLWWLLLIIACVLFAAIFGNNSTPGPGFYSFSSGGGGGGGAGAGGAAASL